MTPQCVFEAIWIQHQNVQVKRHQNIEMRQGCSGLAFEHHLTLWPWIKHPIFRDRFYFLNRKTWKLDQIAIILLKSSLLCASSRITFSQTHDYYEWASVLLQRNNFWEAQFEAHVCPWVMEWGRALNVIFRLAAWRSRFLASLAHCTSQMLSPMCWSYSLKVVHLWAQ